MLLRFLRYLVRQLFQCGDGVAAFVVLRYGLSGCRRPGQGCGTWNLGEDRNAFLFQIRHQFAVKVSEGIEVVYQKEDARLCPGFPRQLVGPHGWFHVPRARKHRNQDEVRIAAPFADTVLEDSGGIYHLEVALFCPLRFQTSFVYASSLRVGGDERHGPAPALKRKSKLVGDGGLRCFMRSFA